MSGEGWESQRVDVLRSRCQLMINELVEVSQLLVTPKEQFGSIFYIELLTQLSSSNPQAWLTHCSCNFSFLPFSILPYLFLETASKKSCLVSNSFNSLLQFLLQRRNLSSLLFLFLPLLNMSSNIF